MAELTEELKVEVTKRLARFQPPAEIVRAMKDEHGLDCSIQQIVAYDPTRPAFRAGERFAAIFEAQRETFTKDAAAVPLFHQGFRLQVLQSALEHHLKHKKIDAAVKVVEQAAKEVGGVYSNVSTVNTPDLKKETPLETADQRAAKLASLLDGAIAGMAAKATAPGSEARQ